MLINTEHWNELKARLKTVAGMEREGNYSRERYSDEDMKEIFSELLALMNKAERIGYHDVDEYYPRDDEQEEN